jgi:coenzyme Q-binding protein COQ10
MATLSHDERRRMPYSAEQMYDLVAAIDRYPQFLPWLSGARLARRVNGAEHWELLIGFKMLRERFLSEVIFEPKRRINARYLDGPLKHLTTNWTFQPVEGGCEIDFQVEFEFKSRLLGRIIEVFFNEAIVMMTNAFESRARALYGIAGVAATARAVEAQKP